jgi:hypothetical protein
MRRPLMAMALGGLLLIGPGCGSDSQPAATAPATTPAVTSAAPSASADYTADTKKVCDEIKKALGEEANGFAEELGKVIVYQQTGNRALADKATAAAQQKLEAFASTVEEKTAAAQNPDVRAAGQEAARNIRATATNDQFFASLKEVKLNTSQERSAFTTKLEKESSSWAAPLGAFCGP